MRAAVCVAALLSASVRAQSTYGSITGTVTDASAGVIRNAQVTAANQATGARRTTTTDANGSYVLSSLDAGTYTIAVSADGFANLKSKGLELLSREVVRADFKLEIAGRAEMVEVSETQLVVSNDLTHSASHSGDEIQSLALNFRATASPSPIVVANLAPTGQTDRQGNITIGGQLPTATSYSLDGIATQNPRYGGPITDLFPSVENIAEFRVNTSGNSAEYSQPSDVTVVTKGGTNDFHGTAYWYFQRRDFNSADQISGVTPNGDADTFGFALGGPLFIPKVYNGKNKTFFFFDYEGIRLNLDAFISTFTPPNDWRTGDFSGAGATLINPLAGAPFPGNKIPTALLNPVSQKALKYFFPAPTGGGAQLSSPNFVQPYPGTYQSDGFDGRLDQVIGTKHRLWGRVTQKNIPFTGTDVSLGALGAGDSTYNPNLGAFTLDSDLTNIAGSYTWVVRPNLINELRLGYSRANFLSSFPQAAQGDSITKDLGIGGLPGSPKNGLGGVPVFYIGDFFGGQTNPYGHPRLLKTGTFEFANALSWIHGRHSFKFGFEFNRRNYQDNITFLLGDEYGDYFYTGDFTAIGVKKDGNVHGFADFLLGLTADAYQAQNGPDGKPFGYHYGGFLQDEWKIRRDLTMTAGVRYEINTPFNDATNQLGNFDRNYPGGRLVVQGQSGLALVNPQWKAAVGNTPFVTNDQVGLPSTLRYTYKYNIQPRLGFAWNPGGDPKTVVRASSGFYSVPVLGAVLYSLLGVDTSYFAEYPSSATNPRILPNIFSGSAAGVSFPSYRRANQYDLKDPRVIQWNLSVERNLGANLLARVSYVGSHTYNLIYSPDLNQVQPNTQGYAALTATPALRQQNLRFPNFSEVLTRDNGPSSKYEAMTIELNRRFARGLTFNNSYTLADNKTNALGVAPSSAIPTGGQGDNGNNVGNYYNIAMDTGNAFFTRRHRFVSTYVYDLPFGRGQKFYNNISRGANLLVGGWRVTGITLLQSGPWLTPFFPSSFADPSGTNPAQRSVKQQRPDCVDGKSGYLDSPTTSVYFDKSAFSIPASRIGRYGNCGTGILEGPGTVNYSMSMGKTFSLTERIGLKYEAQFANLFNFLNRDIPNMNVSSSSFGRISQSQPSEQAGPRSIQMTLRLTF